MSPRIPVRLLHGRPSRQQGTTLIEALVAVVVLSIGLLGMAGLQANALKLNQTSMQRSQATILAYSILDQMRSDTAAAKAGDYDLAFDGEPAEGSALETWLDEVTRSLGASARGEVCRLAVPDDTDCTDAASDVFLISVQWAEAEIENADGTTPLAGGTRTLTVVGRL
ncbi:type IV pilus modification protein PilV [Thauera sp. SDU_THAU2]|uniref:type IV pilus modification protein PilV n=1 Tax=Thauera sp. SDU_THAU2 TaxID=3136633 RepID=UPI00311E285A